MRDKLIQYIDLLFAGTPDAEDVKQEIMQNTLDRYDDLIAQGKSPEAAYSLSIAGIGDIHEIITEGKSTQSLPSTTAPVQKKRSRLTAIAVAVALFILCPVPVIILENSIGVCLLFVLIAAGVMLLIMNNHNTAETPTQQPRSTLHRVLDGIVWGGGICFYLAISFLSGAWYITWLVFPIIICTSGLINACFDLNKVFLNAVVRIVIFSVLILVLIVSLLGACLGITVSSFIEGEYEQINGSVASSGSVPAQEVNDIEIQWVSGSITVQPGDVQNIQFSENSGLSSDDQMVWSHSGDRLIIQFCKPQFNITMFGNISTPAKDLVITVPRDWFCDELEIDSVSAQINVSHLSAREADLVNVSGLCKLQDCSITDFNAETISGNVVFNGQTTTMEINSVSADCTAKLESIPSNVDLESVSGDLTLTLPTECGFTMELDSVSGELISEFATTVKSDRYISGDGSCEITADTVSGDVRIQKSE